MNNENENKSAGLKYLLFIGIPVIIILGVLGAYYQMTSPLSVITKTINTTYKSLDSLLIENKTTQDINETPISIKGNLTFKTDLDLNGYEKLQDYNYDINININLKKEFISLGLGMNDQEKTIIQGNFYQIGDKQYVESETLINKIIELPNNNKTFDELFNFQDLNIEKLNQNINDLKYMLKAGKDAFIDTLDKQYITREKTDITIDGRQVKTTKITYLLNKENQQRTWQKIQEKLKNDETFIETIARLNNSSNEKVIENLEEEFTYQNDYRIIIYTEGLNQNVIKISLFQDAVEQVNYIHYSGTNTINIQNEIILTIKKFETNNLELDYNIKSANISGTVRANSKEKNPKDKETDGNFYFKINSSDINLEINLDLNIIENQEIQIPNISNATKQEDLTTEDIGKIFENLEKSLEGTILYKIIEQNIM